MAPTCVLWKHTHTHTREQKIGVEENWWAIYWENEREWLSSNRVRDRTSREEKEKKEERKRGPKPKRQIAKGDQLIRWGLVCSMGEAFSRNLPLQITKIPQINRKILVYLQFFIYLFFLPLRKKHFLEYDFKYYIALLQRRLQLNKVIIPFIWIYFLKLFFKKHSFFFFIGIIYILFVFILKI